MFQDFQRNHILSVKKIHAPEVPPDPLRTVKFAIIVSGGGERRLEKEKKYRKDSWAVKTGTKSQMVNHSPAPSHLLSPEADASCRTSGDTF